MLLSSKINRLVWLILILDLNEGNVEKTIDNILQVRTKSLKIS